ncbi:MAG: NAD(FAD)-utilizing dehydrogenase, partial [Firmicutes bacterium]|nr:NAD(FAD)-utilizing dehydrogenase [Bacillota bacterium]
MIRIHGIKLRLDQSTDRLIRKAERQLRVPEGTIESARIAKESLDAREKPLLYRVFSLDIESERPDEWLIEACRKSGTRWSEEKEDGYRPVPVDLACGKRPVIAGFGPCGMFAALALAECGLRPVVLERGRCMEERVRAVEHFWNGGALDPECNVQFGEGGAGTFSDGKLTTGTKSPYSGWILEQFVSAGASPEILYKQKPHIGTDVLRSVVVNIRKKIESLGGDVRFGCRLEELILKNGKLSAVKWSEAAADGNAPGDKAEGKGRGCAAGSSDGRILRTLETDALILALGHSA